MRRRDNRHRCHYAALFALGGEARGGTIEDVSRMGLRVFLGPGLRRGQRVSFRLTASNRSARVVRIETGGYAGLLLDRALTQSEFREIAAGSLRNSRRHLKQLPESH